MSRLNAASLETIFAACFGPAVELRGGASEPLYEPPRARSPARLWYRENFAASALHETAHWCIAGSERRRQLDFGYAYCPPPRSASAQASFFAAELKVQALESIFAQAAGVRFQASADNLSVDPRPFEQEVLGLQGSMFFWLLASRDSRARRFTAALAASSRSFGQHTCGPSSGQS